MFLPSLVRKRIILPMIFALGVSFGGCGGGGSGGGDSSSSPSGPYQPSGSDGETNFEGIAKVEVGGNDFEIHVTDSYGDGLEGIVVKGENVGGGYGFIARDPYHDYYTNVVYTNSPSKGVVNDGSLFGRVYIPLRQGTGEEFLIEEKDVSHATSHPLFSGVPFSQLNKIYQDNDGLFQNTYLIEFFGESSGQGGLQIASKGNEFRQDWIESSSQGLVLKLTQMMDPQFDPDAYYVDIRQSNYLGVLSHTENEDRLCTLKGDVIDWHGSPIYPAEVDIFSPLNLEAVTNSGGRYVLFQIKEGVHGVVASAYGFDTETVYKTFTFQPSIWSSYWLDFELDLKQPDLETIILQPGPSDGKDALVSSSNPDVNYGSDDELNVFFGDWGSGFMETMSYIQMNISNIPFGSEIVSANLYVYGFDGGGANDPFIYVGRVTSSWQENSITWNNAPEVNSYAYDNLIVSSATAVWNKWDVTPLVDGWVNGTASNNGLYLRIFDSLNEQIFAGFSSDYFQSTQRPYIEVEYYPH